MALHRPSLITLLALVAGGLLLAVSRDAIMNTGSAATTGLVAAYSFDEGTGSTVADASGNGNNGTIANAAWAAGHSGNALSFNGTNAWVAISDSPSLDLSSGMTLEAWVKPRSLSGWRVLVEKEQPGELTYSLYANSDQNKPVNDIYASGAERPLYGTSPLPVQSWTHLAATYDSSTLRLYVNGVAVSSVAQSGPIVTSNGMLRIGGDSVWGEYFDGLIDDVRIYNRALSSTEIQADMNTPVGSSGATPPPPPPPPPPSGGNGLVAAYGFNAGAGTTVTDSSGNGNTGAISGATWTSAGKYGSALSFDGSGNILNIPDSPSLDLSSQMTLEAWVKPATTDMLRRTVIGKDGSGSLAYGLYSNTGMSTAAGGVGLGGPSEIIVRGITQLPANSWTYLAVTYDGAILRLYENGMEAANLAASSPIAVTNGALHIGGSGALGQYFAGVIDEVRIYNVPRTAAAIQSDMNTPIAGSTSPSPPQNTSPPTISGTAQQGQALSANEGTWTDTPTFSYQWQRCNSAGASCVAIAGATSKTYIVAAADVGATLRVVVTGTNSAGSNSGMSAPTAVVTAPPASTSDVTVTVDRTQPSGVSRLALGVTHTQYSLDSWGDSAAVANAKSLLAAVAPYQDQSIYGWGTTNPEPSPGTYDWSSLDARVNLIRSMGAAPVITLCCAPDWMTSLGANTSTYSNIPPTPAHYADFANLAKQIALRYPDVKYYVVWNEMKGFWSSSLNNWDYAAYTNMYNAVYDALKSVDPTIQVGGPYLVIQGTGSGKGGSGTFNPVSSSDMQVIDYWLANKHGADFLALDRSVVQPSQDTNTYTQSDLLSLTHWVADAVAQIRSHTGTTLPVWYAEDYVNPDLQNLNYSDGFQAVALSSLLYNELKAGVSVSLRWQPQGRSDWPSGGDQESLLSDTRNAGGGQPFPYYADFKAFHDFFGPGTQLYTTTSSSSDVEVLASATKTLLINKRPTSITVSVNGSQITMAGYEVRVLDASGPPPPADTTPPTAPSNVQVTGATQTSISLSWSASSDNVGVAGYNVYANGSKVATTSSTSATAGGLSCGTSYTLGVEAFDAGGNVSTRSTVTGSTSTCSDTTPPAAPTNLAETGSTQTTVSISWSASTDNVGVAGYGVYLNGVRVASTSQTTYTYSGLSCGTNYTVAVDAFDASGNRSAQTSMIASTSACSPPPPSSGPCGWGTRPATWQHVVWIIFENHSYNEIIGSSSAPYINSIANQCGLATNFFAESHPSLPNYVAMTSGSTQGISDDNGPSSHPLNVPSIFSQLGSNWKSLEESMPFNCDKSDSGSYAVRHNPAAYYTNINCSGQDIPLASTPDVSAQFTFVTPNACNDMHDCSVGTGDSWLSTFLPKILNSSQYQSGSTAIFITWDEDDSSASNHIPTIVVSPSTTPGTTSGTTYSHYSMLRTTEEMLGLSTFVGSAASATSMRSAFGL